MLREVEIDTSINLRSWLYRGEGFETDMRIETIIFDGDGVVVDSEKIWDRGQEEFLRRRGFVYARERIKPLLTGTSLVEGVRIMQREYGFRGDPEILAQERMEIVKDFFEREVDFIPGFREFYNRVQRKYKTCMATSMAEDLLKIVDRRLNLLTLFDGKIFSLVEVGYRSKPAPDLFLYAARKLESKVENCVVIEDSPHGVEAARRAGMKCIALMTTYDEEKLSGADLFADSYAEIDLTALETNTKQE